MAKKSVTKTSSAKILAKKPAKKRMTAREREELLIENFVGLQKAMTNLSIKFEFLAEQISELLKIYELSAKNFIQGGSQENDKDLLRKIDSLLDQNKTIAKGLVLMEGKVRERTSAPVSFQRPEMRKPRPLPRL